MTKQTDQQTCFPQFIVTTLHCTNTTLHRTHSCRYVITNLKVKRKGKKISQTGKAWVDLYPTRPLYRFLVTKSGYFGGCDSGNLLHHIQDNFVLKKKKINK